MFAQNSIVNVMAISHHEQNMNGQKEAFQRKRPFRPICALITSGTWQDDAEVSREPRTENKESKKIIKIKILKKVMKILSTGS